jgi:hypothetical protein
MIASCDPRWYPPGLHFKVDKVMFYQSRCSE